MVNFEHVAVFWDYENCAPPSGVPGYDIVNSIRQIAHRFGSIKLFKAYLELSELSSPKSLSLRSELQSCGVSLTDCPHNGRKDVADKMMIVDMLTYAIDTPAPATIILISGDRDFVYAVSVLRFRRYRVVLLAPGKTHASLKAQASEVLHWDVDVLGKEPVSARCGLQSTPRAPDEPPSNLHRRNSSVPSVLPAASAPRPTPIMPLRESVPKSAPSVMSPASGHQNSSSEPPSKLGIADRMAPQPAPQTLPQVTGGFAEPQSPLISQSEVSENEGPISDINVHLKTLHDMRSVSGTSSSSYIGRCLQRLRISDFGECTIYGSRAARRSDTNICQCASAADER
ncbi:NYN domain-containing protein [Amylocystis lapponica]|nr:NYN domain-containing protein [Amylocystis lapponica]